MKQKVLFLCTGNADANCPVIPARCEKQHWPFDDPASAVGSEAEIMVEFARVRDQVRSRIEAFVQAEID